MILADTTAYGVKVSASCDKDFRARFKKNRALAVAVEKKVLQIAEDPLRFKALGGPLAGCYRVHIRGSFVLIFSVNERERAVELLRFAHHDEAYK